MVGRLSFCVISAEDKDNFVHQLSYLNRWYHHKDTGKTVQYIPTDKPVTDPYRRLWHVYWTLGRAGWDCVPTHSDNREGVDTEHEEEKSVYTFAPSALLAIERAKFLGGIVRNGKAT